MKGSSITKQALDLPLADRLEIAQALWASIDSQLGETSAQEAIFVARERDAEFETGAVKGLGHDDVIRKARRRIE